MTQRIHVLKGKYDNIKIANSVFTLLKPLESNYGKTKATIDASKLLGDNYKAIQIEIEDYQLL